LQEEEHRLLLRSWETTLLDILEEHAALKAACRAAERVRDAARSLAPQRADGIELRGSLQVRCAAAMMDRDPSDKPTCA
jgi:hypothetical protein